MAFLFVVCDCAACGKLVAANPSCCPSLMIKGRKEAICKSCADRWNYIHRTSQGLEPVPIHPQAYEPEEVP